MKAIPRKVPESIDYLIEGKEYEIQSSDFDPAYDIACFNLIDEVGLELVCNYDSNSPTNPCCSHLEGQGYWELRLDS